MEIQGLAHYKQRFQLVSKAGIEPGLTRVEAALAALGNPHKQLHIIHVAGTNGKGSTIGFLEQLARTRQLNVGVFTSPAFIDVHDQIRFNGEHITNAQMEAAMTRVAAASIYDLTDFELLTVVAFVAFAQANVDVAIIETGMGGLLDATNVVKPVVSVITTIAREHTNFLGDTIESIATHKAGILKFGAPAVIGALPEAARDVIVQQAAVHRIPLYTYAEDFSIEQRTYRFGDIVFDELEPALKGEHQQHNMALAITAFVLFCERLKLHVAPKRVQQAVRTAYVPYRFEQIAPNVYMDGAHNVAGAKALVATIHEQLNERVHIVIGMLRDKDVEGVLQTLAPVAKSFSFMRFEHERALDPAVMQQYVDGRIVTSLRDVEAADAPVVVTGSLYLLASLAK